eukprot:TRINITY_DN2973_c0_g1_i1.p1 TRINITY_DN2973_c0_g1~~TRINITY_DN2973_c0_g1_i1.p1  ORF type:complete len:244 (+),score=30.01 TRINITY_DN2973_c0_g1_i1:150-881(+)
MSDGGGGAAALCYAPAALWVPLPLPPANCCCRDMCVSRRAPAAAAEVDEAGGGGTQRHECAAPCRHTYPSCFHYDPPKEARKFFAVSDGRAGRGVGILDEPHGATTLISCSSCSARGSGGGGEVRCCEDGQRVAVCISLAPWHIKLFRLRRGEVAGSDNAFAAAATVSGCRRPQAAITRCCHIVCTRRGVHGGLVIDGALSSAGLRKCASGYPLVHVGGCARVRGACPIRAVVERCNCQGCSG